MKNQLIIQKENFELCSNLLDSYEDGPTIVGYIRSATDNAASQDGQRQTIMRILQQKFVEPFRLIWVCEVGSGLRHFRNESEHKCLPGLRLVANLVESGIAQHVCVKDCSRISRSQLVFDDFINLLSQHQGSLIAPSVEYPVELGVVDSVNI